MKSNQAKKGQAKPTRAETCAIVQWFFDIPAVLGRLEGMYLPYSSRKGPGEGVGLVTPD